MTINRLLYILALVSAIAFFFASSVWFSWYLLVVLLALPVLGLLLSLPAMLTTRAEFSLPQLVEQGSEALLLMRVTTPKQLPLPDLRLRLRLSHPGDEKEYRYLSRLLRTEGSLALPTGHCGVVRLRAEKIRVYDCLGLFTLHRKAQQLPDLIVLPKPHAPEPMPDLEAFSQLRLKPKPGGGFSEIHDHRPYRDGDPVRDIHWKLSLKTDTLIVREPLEPAAFRTALLVETASTAEGRDRSLGQLRWLSDWLVDRSFGYRVYWMDGEAMRSYPVFDAASAIDALILVCSASSGSAALLLSGADSADWSYRIRSEGGGV